MRCVRNIPELQSVDARNPLSLNTAAKVYMDTAPCPLGKKKHLYSSSHQKDTQGIAR